MDFDKVLTLIRAMNREGVEYITFGAVALNALGILRATEDADFFIKPTEENVKRLRRAIRSIWDDPETDQITAVDLAGDYPAVCYGPPGEDFTIDFVSRLGEMFRYEELEWQIVDFEGVPTRVTTPSTLYRMKRHTVRPKDRIDSEWLKQKFSFPEE